MSNWSTTTAVSHLTVTGLKLEIRCTKFMERQVKLINLQTVQYNIVQNIGLASRSAISQHFHDTIILF